MGYFTNLVQMVTGGLRLFPAIVHGTDYFSTIVVVLPVTLPPFQWVFPFVASGIKDCAWELGPLPLLKKV